MNVLAISGTYCKGRTIDTLVAETLRGVQNIDPGAAIETIRLTERHIEYCRGCLVCHGDDPAKPMADCAIRDDMDDIRQKLYDADGYVFATPMYDATVTAVMKCFLERMSWVMARPGRRPFKGCPEPRNPRPKAAVYITSTGKVPNWAARLFCNVNRAFKDTVPCMLGAPIVGSLYACNVGMKPHSRPDAHLPKAFKLGRTLARRLERLHP